MYEAIFQWSEIANVGRRRQWGTWDIWALVPHSNCLLMQILGGSSNGSHHWVPAIHMGDLHSETRAPGFVPTPVPVGEAFGSETVNRSAFSLWMCKIYQSITPLVNQSRHLALLRCHLGCLCSTMEFLGLIPDSSPWLQLSTHADSGSNDGSSNQVLVSPKGDLGFFPSSWL